VTKVRAGEDGTALASCSDTILQSIKSCVECGYNILPTAFPQEEVRKLQDTINEFGTFCNKLGFSVQPITFNTTPTPTTPTPTPTPTSQTGAALSRYEGSARVAGAVGVAAVAGILAL